MAHLRVLGHLFNGNFVLRHRISQLRAWLDAIGNFKIKPKPVIPGLTDAWLSGFTDAEGCFNVNPRKTNRSVTIRFILDQKK